MNFKESAKLDFKRIIKKLNNKSFDGEDISLLLRNWRPYFKSQDMIWEFACFMAHPEPRDQGLFLYELDVRYSKLIYGILSPTRKFNPYKIEERLFKALLIGGLENTDNEHLEKHTGLNKTQAKNIINRSYKKKGKFYELELSSQTQFNSLSAILNSILSIVAFKPSINNEEILNQFESALNTTIMELKLEYNSKEIVDSNNNEIIICLMCLLHSHQFILFDNSECTCEIRLSRNPQNSKEFEFTLQSHVKLSAGSEIHWTMMEIKGDLAKHFEENDNLNNSFGIIALQGFHPIRNSNGELIVTDSNNI